MISRNTPEKEVLQCTHACKCEHCERGCHYGSGCMVKQDIPAMAKLLGVTEEKLKKEFLEQTELFNTKLWKPKVKKEQGKPYGKCIFFEQGKGCKVHQAKPLQCKTAMGCKEYGEQLNLWFTLNHAVNEYDPESLRQFATYLKSGGKTLPEGELKDLVKDPEKLKKILEYRILR
jgi:Fe-S-cluster containining protein